MVLEVTVTGPLVSKYVEDEFEVFKVVDSLNPINVVVGESTVEVISILVAVVDGNSEVVPVSVVEEMVAPAFVVEKSVVEGVELVDVKLASEVSVTFTIVVVGDSEVEEIEEVAVVTSAELVIGMLVTSIS